MDVASGDVQVECRNCGRSVASTMVSDCNGCCLTCLKSISRAADDGRCTSEQEEQTIGRVGGEKAHTYGEITPLGFRRLAKRFGMNEADTFTDLGSGLGRACIQAAREFHVRRAVGVELAASRHRLALAEREREPEAVASRVELIEADCADEALWATGGAVSGTTLIFAGSLLFGEELMERLARRIECCASVRAVATLKRFAVSGGGGAATGGANGGGVGGGTGCFSCGLSGFHMLNGAEEYETSWTAPLRPGAGSGVRDPGAPVFLYVRDGLSLTGHIDA